MNRCLFIRRIILIRYFRIYFIKCDYLDILNNIYTYHNMLYVKCAIYNILVYTCIYSIYMNTHYIYLHVLITGFNIIIFEYLQKCHHRFSEGLQNH